MFSSGPRPIRRSKTISGVNRGSLFLEIDSVLNGFLSNQTIQDQGNDKHSIFRYMDDVFDGFLSGGKGLDKSHCGYLLCDVSKYFFLPS